MTSRRVFVRSALLGAGAAATVGASRLAQAQSTSEEAFETVPPAGTNGNSDWYLIQQKLNTGRNVYFPPRDYRLHKPLTVTTRGQLLFADGVLQNQDGGTRARIMPGTNLQLETLVDVEADLVSFQGLVFWGIGIDSGIGLRLRNPSNPDDIDTTIFSCIFKKFQTAIDICGRGLQVADSKFAVCERCVTISWPLSGSSGQPHQTHPEHGALRAFNIYNNRIHSCRCCVETDERYLWGLSLQGNLIDVGDALFRGSARHSTISNNVICNSLHTPIEIRQELLNSTIANNVLSGHGYPLPEGDTQVKNPPFGILVCPGAEVRDCTISGNAFSNIEAVAIDLQGSHHSYVAISGNTFQNIGFGAPSVGAAIHFGQDANDFSIVGNSFRNGNNTVPPIRLAQATRITGFEAIGNAFERNRPFIEWNGNLTSGNNIQS